ncbi:YkgJ family cysteine cluster protein [Enterobacter kobei]|uniref:YkgJ family cysteine cluster protein n=1 Tax=Enterobacter cloacae complex TaxID=354276 RepID=UPI0019515D33|nr:hypothetical protein [Enterobacter hormaechei]MBM6486064.1 hypothetical protein [Enterobacter hormaechei]
MSFEKYLVPERNCGECTVCCISLRIEQPELTKGADIPCPNLSPTKGCAIYDSRPTVCRTWFCGWRVMPFVKEDMRPDKMKILIKIDGSKFIFQPLKAENITALLNQNVMEAMASFVMNGLEVHTSIPTRPGFCNALLSVNEVLKPSLETKILQEGQQAIKGLIFRAKHSLTLPEDVSPRRY